MVPMFPGGDKRDRTADLLNAIQEQNCLEGTYFKQFCAFLLKSEEIQNHLKTSYLQRFS